MLMRCSILLSLVLSVAACKAKPAEPAGYVDAERQANHPDLPFHRAWRNPAADLKNYDRVSIAPVDTNHLQNMSWWDEQGADVKKDIAEIAAFTHEQLEAAFAKESKSNRYTLVTETGSKSARTLILEFAIVQVIPRRRRWRR